MPVELWRVGLAALPLVFLLIVLLWLRWSGVRSGLATLAFTILLAVPVFRLPPAGVAVALWRAVALSLDVLYIIWAALILYMVAETTGAIRGIGLGVAHLTGDRTLQLLIIGIAFSSFLQGVAGFGVPVAVTAPLLLGLGFAPLEAAAVPLIGHSWAVTMGTLASSFQALRAVTGLPPRDLGVWIAVLLGIASVMTGFAVGHLHGGVAAIRRAFGAILGLGLVMAVVQYVVVLSENYTVASFVASMVGLGAGLGIANLTRRYGPRLGGLLPQPADGEAPASPDGAPADPPPMPFAVAFLPYFALIVVVGLATFLGPLRRALSVVRFTFSSPSVFTALGWRTDAARSVFPLLGHPGALILYAAAAAVLLYARIGHPVQWARLWTNTRRQGVPTTITILTLVGVATLMTYSGMTFLLASGLARVTGALFPVVSPFLGLLGTVITGSNTNSNVLFGALQRDAARLLRMDPVLLCALQSAGGALGSMVAPAKVVLATATTGLAGQEGQVMRVTGRYVLAMTAVLGLLGLLWTL